MFGGLEEKQRSLLIWIHWNPRIIKWEETKGKTMSLHGFCLLKLKKKSRYTLKKCHDLSSLQMLFGELAYFNNSLFLWLNFFDEKITLDTLRKIQNISVDANSVSCNLETIEREKWLILVSNGQRCKWAVLNQRQKMSTWFWALPGCIRMIESICLRW